MLGINPVVDNMGVRNFSGTEEISARNIESSDKVSNDVSCVVKKSVNRNFCFNDFAKTFYPKCEYVPLVVGLWPQTNLTLGYQLVK